VGFPKSPMKRVANAIRLALLISSALNRTWNGFNGLLIVLPGVPPHSEEDAGLQRVSILTEVSNSEIAAPNNVWVPAAK
jgi:hypothetical protein